MSRREHVHLGRSIITHSDAERALLRQSGHIGPERSDNSVSRPGLSPNFIRKLKEIRDKQ
jgi:hypothetical protein